MLTNNYDKFGKVKQTVIIKDGYKHTWIRGHEYIEGYIFKVQCDDKIEYLRQPSYTKYADIIRYYKSKGYTKVWVLGSKQHYEEY